MYLSYVVCITVAVVVVELIWSHGEASLSQFPSLRATLAICVNDVVHFLPLNRLLYHVWYMMCELVWSIRFDSSLLSSLSEWVDSFSLSFPFLSFGSLSVRISFVLVGARQRNKRPGSVGYSPNKKKHTRP